MQLAIVQDYWNDCSIIAFCALMVKKVRTYLHKCNIHYNNIIMVHTGVQKTVEFNLLSIHYSYIQHSLTECKM